MVNFISLEVDRTQSLLSNTDIIEWNPIRNCDFSFLQQLRYIFRLVVAARSKLKIINKAVLLDQMPFPFRNGRCADYKAGTAAIACAASSNAKGGF